MCSTNAQISEGRDLVAPAALPFRQADPHGPSDYCMQSRSSLACLISLSRGDSANVRRASPRRFREDQTSAPQTGADAAWREGGDADIFPWSGTSTGTLAHRSDANQKEIAAPIPQQPAPKADRGVFLGPHGSDGRREFSHDFNRDVHVCRAREGRLVALSALNYLETPFLWRDARMGRDGWLACVEGDGIMAGTDDLWQMNRQRDCQPLLVTAS